MFPYTQGDYLVKGRIERLASEDGLQGSEERHALLAHRGEVASDASERLGAAVGAEGARNFLLDLEHAQILLRLVIVEGDGEVVEESQDPSFPSSSRSNRLRVGDCLIRPRRCPTRSGGGLAASPAPSRSS